MQTLTITESLLDGLPAPVRRYLTYTGVVGFPRIETVDLHYTGKFRLGRDKPWMPLTVHQVYTTTPPGFQWRARFKMFGLPLMAARDTYQGGKAHMFGKLAGLVTIFDDRSEALLQGTMMRYLQEMMWFPTAYLGELVTWEAVDDHCADVTFTYGGRSVQGRMYFGDDGRILSFVGERGREVDGDYTMDTWATPITDYARIAGLNLPATGSGVWQLDDGDLTYITLNITDVRYNGPVPEFGVD